MNGIFNLLYFVAIDPTVPKQFGVGRKRSHVVQRDAAPQMIVHNEIAHILSFFLTLQPLTKN